MKVLVVVDMQNDFITGSLGTPEAQAIVPNVKKKIEESVANGDFIVFTRDTHFENYLTTREGEKLPVEHCVRGTHGWQIRSELMPPATYKNVEVLDKFTFGAPELPVLLIQDERTRKCDEIELVGLVSDICVISNALILKAAFYESATVSVDSACTAGTTKENYQSALNIMKSCQIEVI